MNIWFLANCLSLNLAKASYCIFSMSALILNDVALKLMIGGHVIVKSSCCKYLGVLMDERLNWKLHVDYVFTKLIKFTGIFYKIRDFVPATCLKKLYYSFVYPHLLFGIEVYGTACDNVLDRLHKLNNRILRILLRERRDSHVRDLYIKYKVLPLSLLYRMKLLQIVHKCIHHRSIMPVIYHDIFVFNNNVHQHNTRKSGSLHMSCTNSMGSRCLNFRGSKYWNILPPVLRQYSSLAVFKNLIFKHLQNAEY